MDWNKLKQEYISGNTSYRKLAEKYKVSISTLSKRAMNEKWAELKSAAQQESNRRIIKVVANRQKKRAERLQNIADTLLKKAEQAVAELDTQLCKTVEKTKVIEYKNRERPDKPTKEIINESEKISEFHTIVDRKGLQSIAAALKSIQEIYNLNNELDRREQKARIKKLEKEAEGDLIDNEIKVVFCGDDSEDYCK